VWAEAPRRQIESAVSDLLSRQNADGGWAQLPVRKSDAYATGEALYALKQSNNAPQTYDRGVRFLIDTQLQDGSWLVETRLHEVAHISPPKMETGFPHGPNQIMSMYGTTWAVAALSLALPEQTYSAPEFPEIHATAESWVDIAAFGTLDELKGVDPASHTALGSTPLMVVVNDAAKTAALIERGADVTAKAKSGQTALAVSATLGGAATVMRLLVAAGASAVPQRGVEFNSNPLVYVGFSDDPEAAAILLDAGASMHQPMVLQGLVRTTPLTAAVQTNAARVLREYLKRGADPNTVEEVPLLTRAVIANRSELAKILIEAGADPDVVDQYGWTPLQHVQGVEHDVDLTSSLIRSASEAKRSTISGGGAQ
jgi:ankyrin repeat protein